MKKRNIVIFCAILILSNTFTAVTVRAFTLSQAVKSVSVLAEDSNLTVDRCDGCEIANNYMKLDPNARAYPVKMTSTDKQIGQFVNTQSLEDIQVVDEDNNVYNISNKTAKRIDNLTRTLKQSALSNAEISKGSSSVSNLNYFKGKDFVSSIYTSPLLYNTQTYSLKNKKIIYPLTDVDKYNKIVFLDFKKPNVVTNPVEVQIPFETDGSYQETRFLGSDSNDNYYFVKANFKPGKEGTPGAWYETIVRIDSTLKNVVQLTQIPREQQKRIPDVYKVDKKGNIYRQNLKMDASGNNKAVIFEKYAANANYSLEASYNLGTITIEGKIYTLQDYYDEPYAVSKNGKYLYVTLAVDGERSGLLTLDAENKFKEISKINVYVFNNELVYASIFTYVNQIIFDNKQRPLLLMGFDNFTKNRYYDAAVRISEDGSKSKEMYRSGEAKENDYYEKYIRTLALDELGDYYLFRMNNVITKLEF